MRLLTMWQDRSDANRSQSCWGNMLHSMYERRTTARRSHGWTRILIRLLESGYRGKYSSRAARRANAVKTTTIRLSRTSSLRGFAASIRISTALWNSVRSYHPHGIILDLKTSKYRAARYRYSGIEQESAMARARDSLFLPMAGRYIAPVRLGLAACSGAVS